MSARVTFPGGSLIRNNGTYFSAPKHGGPGGGFATCPVTTRLHDRCVSGWHSRCHCTGLFRPVGLFSKLGGLVGLAMTFGSTNADLFPQNNAIHFFQRLRVTPPEDLRSPILGTGDVASRESCQIRDDLLNRWSDAAKALSASALNRSELSVVEKARIEVRKAHEAFDRHAQEHGCWRMDHPIVK